MFVVLVDRVLDQPCGNAGIQQAEVLDVERHRFLVLPGGEEFGVVLVGAQQPGAAPRIAHLAPLADQLAGVPVDPLAGLLVQVEADAVDIRGDFLVAFPRPSHQGGEGVADLLAFDVSHDGFKIAGPGKVFDAAADGRLVVRGAGDEPVEGQRIRDRRRDDGGGLPGHMPHEAAEPFQVVPDGPVELCGAVPDDPVVRHARKELVREVQRGFQPGRGLGHAGALDLERLDLVRQRQGLQEQQFDGQLFGGARCALEVLPKIRHHGGLGVRNAALQAFQQLRGGRRCPRSGAAVQGGRFPVQPRAQDKPCSVFDLLGDA